MNVGNVAALDLDGAICFELDAPGGAGAYGAVVSRALERGLYMVIVDSTVCVRDSDSQALRLGTGGNKLEVPFTVDNPMPIVVRTGNVVMAARDAAALVWFVPMRLLSADDVADVCRAR